MSIVWNCTTDITLHINTGMDENENYLLGREKRLSFAQKQRMQCLCGDVLSMEAANAVSTAPYSETKANIDPATLYGKRMKLLIESGLVAGITPTSTRKRSNQQTLDFALSRQDGDDSIDEPEVG